MTRPHVAIVAPALDELDGTGQMLGWELRALLDRAQVTFFTDAGQAGKLKGATIVPVGRAHHPLSAFGREAWFKAASRAVRGSGEKYSAVYAPGIHCDCATHINVYANFTQWVELHKGAPLKGLPVELQRRLQFRRLSNWEKRFYRQPGIKLATVSNLAAARLQKDFGARRVRVFPATPEPGRFTPQAREQLRKPARQRLGIAPHEFVVAIMGNAWFSKGFDLLLAAWPGFSARRSARLLMISAERPAHLQTMLGALPANVQVLGRERQVENVYAAADLVVLPSRGETFGFSIAEAAAMHVPVRVSEFAGVSCYVPETCIVRPNTASAWRKTMTEVAKRKTVGNLPAETAAMLAKNDAKDRAAQFAAWVLG